MLDDKKKNTGVGGVYHPGDSSKVREKLKAGLQRLNVKITHEKSKNVVNGSIVVLDFGNEGANFTVPCQFDRWQTIKINFLEPSPLEIRAIVQWCGPGNNNKGIRSVQKSTGYRIGVQFLFEHEQAKGVVSAFIKTVKDRFANPSTIEVNPEPVEGEDEEIGAKPQPTDKEAASAEKSDAQDEAANEGDSQAASATAEANEDSATDEPKEASSEETESKTDTSAASEDSEDSEDEEKQAA